ncbi:GntR family transcriptional regulator [Leifsonia sp. NPDC058248]|uniref:GntR family transcriptional regulator n=1 Tax=Leifsonia sp. NPDC058248 TaxID=3346402 RepID=UPI0036DE6735
MPLPTEHVRRTSLSEEAYIRIEAAIMEGTLEPEERLRDSELELWLGISRTPIRHALDRLAEQGLVETERNRFTRVAPFDIGGVRRALEVAGDLWAGAARRGVAGLSDDDIALVDEATHALIESAVASDIARFARVFQHLVTVFAQFEENPSRLRALNNVFPQVRRLARKLTQQINEQPLREFVAGLTEATHRRDAEAACAAISTYVDHLVASLTRAAN